MGLSGRAVLCFIKLLLRCLLRYEQCLLPSSPADFNWWTLFSSDVLKLPWVTCISVGSDVVSIVSRDYCTAVDYCFQAVEVTNDNLQ